MCVFIDIYIPCMLLIVVFRHKPSSLESDEDSDVSSPINSLTKSPTRQVATEDSANQSSADTAPPAAAVTSKPLKSSSSFLVASFSFLNSQKPNPLSHPGNATTNAASTNSIITDNDNNNRGKSPQLPPGKMIVKITYIEELVRFFHLVLTFMSCFYILYYIFCVLVLFVLRERLRCLRFELPCDILC